MEETLIHQRRQQADRRSQRLRTALHACYRNRRQKTRRSTDPTVGVYTDTHEVRVLALAVGLVVLSIMDAFFTTVLLHNGSYELNPFLAVLIDRDLVLFILVKMAITSAGALFLVLHKNFLLFNRVSGYQLLVTCCVIYVLLMCYHFFLMNNLLIL